MAKQTIWAQIEGDDGRRLPIQSLQGETAEQTKVLRDLLYLQEIRRQAEIFTSRFEAAWARATDRATEADDGVVWADLQSAIFSAIVVARLLSTHRVQRYPHHDSIGQSAAFQHKRAAELRSLLGVQLDSVIFSVSGVRDALEHVDERMDWHMRDDVICLSDWYISDGL
ncbi:MAG TPA: hypothetical protein VME70_14270, partial [Mycobacteriales bacterium]|nr:hypothetical protein [Mycobacteriales bacterium]